MLAQSIDQFLTPFREKRRELEANPREVRRVLAEGAEKASREASRTMEEIRKAMNVE
jgi:tryptophanyl-tRNA synthetase